MTPFALALVYSCFASPCGTAITLVQQQGYPYPYPPPQQQQRGWWQRNRGAPPMLPPARSGGNRDSGRTDGYHEPPSFDSGRLDSGRGDGFPGGNNLQGTGPYGQETPGPGPNIQGGGAYGQETSSGSGASSGTGSGTRTIRVPYGPPGAVGEPLKELEIEIGPGGPATPQPTFPDRRPGRGAEPARAALPVTPADVARGETVVAGAQPVRGSLDARDAAFNIKAWASANTVPCEGVRHAIENITVRAVHMTDSNSKAVVYYTAHFGAGPCVGRESSREIEAIRTDLSEWYVPEWQMRLARRQ